MTDPSNSGSAPPTPAPSPSTVGAGVPSSLSPSVSSAPPEALAPTAPLAAPETAASKTHQRPSFVFFGVVSALSLAADIGSKVWAEISLIHRASHPIVIIEDHLNLTLAYNPGGAWGLAQNASEQLRKPFFVLVSMAAIWFIFSLYGRLATGQRALKWGLPLVLGGALGNLADRLTRSQVIDFIDYRADWIRSMNEQIAKVHANWSVTDHWPTFNVADIAICVGVGLMAVDMITSRRGSPEPVEPAPLTQKSVAPAALGDSEADAADETESRSEAPADSLPQAGPNGAAAGGQPRSVSNVPNVPER